VSVKAPGTIRTGQWTCSTEAETFALGVSVGECLAGGEILLLNGPLGAGKTIFVKGLAAGLVIDPAEVTSPSFTLINNHEGRKKLYHIDLYRLEQGAAAAHAVDLEELLAEEQSIIVIEWADRMGPYPLPPGQVWSISIEGDGDEPRLISIDSLTTTKTS
jgi:tRNA threonylcarbamoyladenosine biosynthesis protein TsaE